MPGLLTGQSKFSLSGLPSVSGRPSHSESARALSRRRLVTEVSWALFWVLRARLRVSLGLV